MPRDIGERGFALRQAVILVNLAEQPLGPRLMRVGVEDKAAGLTQLSLPSGKTSSR